MSKKLETMRGWFSSVDWAACLSVCLAACLAVIFAAACSGCAVLHKVQLGEIDNRDGFALIPFEIKVSETGVDLQEAAEIARGVSQNSQNAQAASDVAAIVSLFQMGPRTGKPVYSDSYARKLVYTIHQQCPSGRITGLTSIRETRSYPVVSGEIVKVTGYCMRPRRPANDAESPSESGRTKIGDEDEE